MEMDSHGESHDGKEEESKDAPRTRRSGSDTLPIFPPISAGTGHRRAGTSVITHLFTEDLTKCGFSRLGADAVALGTGSLQRRASRHRTPGSERQKTEDASSGGGGPTETRVHD